MKTPTGLSMSMLCVAVLACSPVGAQKVPPERAEAAREALVTWLECTECRTGELDAVERYAPELEQALITTLKRGPAPAKLAEIEDKLRAQFQANVTANGWAPAEENQYVKTYLQNADQAYRLRAVTALGRIKTSGAITALREALAPTSGQSADVRRAAKETLASLSP
jgi:hypothetical protein